MRYLEMLIDLGLITGMLSIIFIVVLLLKFKKNATSKLIILLFFNVFCLLLHYYAYLHHVKFLGAIATFFGLGMGYLLGPVIYFLMKSFLGQTSIKPQFYYHLIPFFIHFLLCSIPLAIFIQFGEFYGYFEGYIKIELYLYVVECLYLFVYLFLSLKLILKAKNIYLNNYSSIEKANLNWLRDLLVGFFVVAIFAFLTTIYEMFYGSSIWVIGNIIAFLYSALCLYLGMKGIFQTTLLLPQFQEISSHETNSATHQLLKLIQPSEQVNDKSEKVQETFSPQEVQELKCNLDSLMNDKKLYRNADLNLAELADELSISNKKLSELLNQYLETNFYSFINDYRIKEVKERLNQGEAEKYTIMSIAYDSGFQSKASFYRIFKQKLGVSPSEFIKQIPIENTPSLS